MSSDKLVLNTGYDELVIEIVVKFGCFNTLTAKAPQKNLYFALTVVAHVVKKRDCALLHLQILSSASMCFGRE